MEIKLHEISVRDVFKGYENDEESGRVVAFGGRLNVRRGFLHFKGRLFFVAVIKRVTI